MLPLLELAGPARRCHRAPARRFSPQDETPVAYLITIIGAVSLAVFGAILCYLAGCWLVVWYWPDSSLTRVLRLGDRTLDTLTTVLAAAAVGLAVAQAGHLAIAGWPG